MQYYITTDVVNQGFQRHRSYNILMNKFAERLRELRLEKGLSQDGLAKATGISQDAISRWELKQRTATIDNVIILAKFFCVSIDFLVGLVD